MTNLKKIYRYNIIIPKDRGYSIPQEFRKNDIDTFEIIEYPVLYENEDQLVIKYYWLAIINKKNDKYSLHSILEKERLYLEDNSLFTEWIHYSIFTTKKKKTRYNKK